MYDSVLSVGIGACLAQKSDPTVSGESHVDAIRSVEFTGATGRVQFGNADGDPDRLGTRHASSTQFGAYNVRVTETTPGDFTSSLVLTDLRLPGNTPTQWEQLQEIIYRDGRTIPPDLLRDAPEQNFLTPALQVTGLTMMACAIFSALLCAAWIYICREHRILKASQPPFLIVVCFGTLLQASTIFPLSFDESDGWSDQSLDRKCMAVPWLFALGTMLVYGALFAKLWRLDRTLQFSRRKIGIKAVLWPTVILVFLMLVVLTTWTAIDPVRWERVSTVGALVFFDSCLVCPLHGFTINNR